MSEALWEAVTKDETGAFLALCELRLVPRESRRAPAGTVEKLVERMLDQPDIILRSEATELFAEHPLVRAAWVKLTIEGYSIPCGLLRKHPTPLSDDEIVGLSHGVMSSSLIFLLGDLGPRAQCALPRLLEVAAGPGFLASCAALAILRMATPTPSLQTHVVQLFRDSRSTMKELLGSPNNRNSVLRALELCTGPRSSRY